MTTTAFTLTYTVAASTAPAWFTALPYLQWHPIAAGGDARFTALDAMYRGNRLSDPGVVEPPPYQGNQSPDDIIEAGNGAAVDQDNLVFMLICNGGHSGRNENSSFDLQLNVATPGYRRITDSTPYADLNWHFDQPAPADGGDPLAYEYYGRLQTVDPSATVVASGTRTWNMPDGTTVDIRDWPACSGDGAVTTGSTIRQQWKPWTIGTNLNLIDDRPRTMHTCYTPWYTNGKVWFPVQNSVDEGTGPTHNVIMSFNMTAVRAGTIPRPFVPGRDVWDYYRPVTELGASGNLFGSTALDPLTGKIWYHPGNEAQVIAVNTTGTPGTYTRYADPVSPQSHFLNAASAISPVAGRRLWVVLAAGDNGTQNAIHVFQLATIEAAGAISTTSHKVIVLADIASKSWNFSHTATNDYKKGWGMVWHEADRSFLLYSCDDMNRSGARSGYLRRIKPPLNADGSYDAPTDAEIAAGTHGWTCDEIAIGGYLPDLVTSSGVAISGSSFTRFNIFNDMGNGEACLISQGAWDTPAYVCRLPNSTLTGV